MDNTVFIIDDDPAIRDSLSLLLGLHGYRTLVFADATGFLSTYRQDWYGCILLDLRMPHMDGLKLQQELMERGCILPVIIITGHGDVSSAREAFRAQAIDFLEKPLDQERLIQAIEEGFKAQSDRRNLVETKTRLSGRLSELTPREREVMELVVAGNHNRHIAGKLGISVRTVEVHKARMMTKLGATSVSQLVHLSLGMEHLLD
jgi:FixJ family two-component response regulator